MILHKKKRVEIVIERPLLRRLIAKLDELEVSGYSVVPVLAGSGREGRWDAAGLVGDAGQMVSAICVLDGADLERFLDAIFPLVERQIGIVTVCDVEVIRSGRF